MRGSGGERSARAMSEAKPAAQTGGEGDGRVPYPVTPDGRYFVVRGRLWRCTDPRLPAAEREGLTRELMRTRGAVRRAKHTGAPDELKAARARVHATKLALGERGPVWWSDGAPDYNRHLARNTPYRDWFEGLSGPHPPLA